MDHLTTRTLQAIHSILRRSIRRAQARDKVVRNVAALIDTPEGRKAGRPSKAMTLDQATTVLGHAKEKLKAGKAWQDNDLVFCTGVGTPLDAANVRRSFRRITKAAGLGECPAVARSRPPPPGRAGRPPAVDRGG